MWEKGEFSPEKFSQYQKKEVCLDKGWGIAFWINFVFTVVFMIVVAAKKLESTSVSDSENVTYLTNLAYTLSQKDISTPSVLDIDDDDENITIDVGLDVDAKEFYKAIGIGVAVGFVLTLIHFGYMVACPAFYIKFGLWVGVIFVCVMMAIVAFVQDDGNVRISIFVCIAFILLLAFCVFCCCLKDFIEFTCMVFERTTQIEKNSPAIFLVVFIQIIIEFIANFIYCLAFLYIAVNNWSYLIYIYYLFSYYWVIITNYYVFFLISANLAANAYFLEGTEYFPESPVWDSVKRSTTSTFGSASFAGFIAALLTTLETIAEQLMKSDNSYVKIIGCIVYCIVCCLQAIFHHISRYGLFYVTVYNVPFLEGARRFTEISVKKFINTFMGESILSTSLTYNSFIFMVFSIIIGVAIGIGYYEKFREENIVQAALLLVAYIIFTVMFTEVFLWCLLNPADTITYSLFICFTEFPERLKIVDNRQYEFFVYRYSCSTARATNNPLPPRPEYLNPQQ